MSIVRQEGFAHFTSGSDWLAKGHTIGGVNYSFNGSSGRDGRGEAVVGLNAHLLLTTTAAEDVVFHHFACYTGSRSNAQIASYRNATNDNIVLTVLGDGSIQVDRSSSTFGVVPFLPNGATTLGTTVPALFRNGVWHQFQIKVKIHASTGEVTIKMDGIEVLSVTGANTYNGAGGVYTTQIGMASNGGSSDVHYSDLVVCNDSGSIYNTYLGDVAVYEAVAPVDGDLLQWTRSTGAGTWSSHVDENPQDGDSSYLSSANLNERVCFSFPVISSVVGTVLAVKEAICHRKDAASTAVIKLFSRAADDVNHDGDQISVTESYKFDERIYETDQSDGSSWTVSKVNATQLGVVNVST